MVFKEKKPPYDCIKEKSLSVVAVWYLCRTFGLLPLTIKRNKQGIWTASYSVPWVWYSWITIIYLDAGSMYGVKLLIDNIFKNATSININTLLIICSIAFPHLITSLVGCASCMRHAKQLIKVNLLIEKVDSILEWAQIKKIKDWKFTVMFGVLVVSTGAALTADIYGLFAYALQYNDSSLPSFFICNYLVYAVSCVMLVRLISSVYPLRMQFNHVRQVMEMINRDLDILGNKDSSGLFPLKISSVLQGRLLTSKAASILAQDQSSSAFILILLIIYRSVYYMILLIKSPMMTLMRALIHIVYICSEILKLLCLVETCYQASQESHRWIQSGAEMLSKIRDPDLRNDLKYCINCATHEPLDFVAYGIFRINRELNSMVIGVIITTVLILVQVT